MQEMRKYTFSEEHIKAVNRPRRISRQFDATGNYPELYDLDIDFLIERLFLYVDMEGSQIDSIWWDCRYLLPWSTHPLLKTWKDQGLDIVGMFLKETKKRGRECFWNHRVGTVDIICDGLDEKGKNPIKLLHPDWVVECWWEQGLWNLASEGLRNYQVENLKRIFERYDFDGLQLDFSRHVPCVPLGEQWENREHITLYVRMVREMLMDFEKKKKHPIILSVKVPETLEGCRIDGFDIKTWAEEDLVDIFTLGSRTMNVKVNEFKTLTYGKNIKLHACFDDHHTTDGYRYAPIEFFRGVFGNWWDQGIDGVVTFNWSILQKDDCSSNDSIWIMAGPASHREAYLEAGNFDDLSHKDKIFAVERKGGYPWAGGYFNRNDNAPLPVVLNRKNKGVSFPVRICDNVNAKIDKIKNLKLHITVFNLTRRDDLSIQFNGIILKEPVADFSWKDPQIFSPESQPDSGGDGQYNIDPEQKLARLSYKLNPGIIKKGDNKVGIIFDNFNNEHVKIEKIEIHLTYLHE